MKCKKKTKNRYKRKYDRMIFVYLVQLHHKQINLIKQYQVAFKIVQNEHVMKGWSLEGNTKEIETGA